MSLDKHRHDEDVHLDQAGPLTRDVSDAALLFGASTPLAKRLLPGVGPVRAGAIVAWRNANGKFTSVDQLGEVDGIGPGRLEKLRPLVRV